MNPPDATDQEQRSGEPSPGSETGESRRFLLTVAYDGRPWAGWQSQAGGRTVQDRLLQALRTIHPGIAPVQGAGRTDSGVSALGQAAHFDAPPGSRLDADAWQRALNSRLPASIRVMRCEPVPPGFHARFSARGKTYRYRLWTGPVLPPLEADLAWHVIRPLDLDLLEASLSCYRGRHDFRAFSANRGDGFDATRDTWRVISAAALRRGEQWLEIDYTGNGFLYRMARILTGAAVWTAAGKLPASAIPRWLKGVSVGEKAPYCAPADGLTLMAVHYRDTPPAAADSP